MFARARLIPRLNVEFGLEDLRVAVGRSEVWSQQALVELERWWPGRYPVFVDSGRTALQVALRALKLASGARVGVPLFTCGAVFEAIRQAGCQPVFLETSADSCTLDPETLAARSRELAAVVVVHTFGYPADMRAITTAAGGLPIIEDCAHAVGATYAGKVVGNFGDASFFSFRSGKQLSVGNLGMLLSSSQASYGEAKSIVERMTTPTSIEHAVTCLTEVARSGFYHRPLFGTFSLPVGLQVDERLDLMDKRSFLPMRAAAGAVKVLAVRLSELDRKLARRREIARRLLGVLPDDARALRTLPQTEPSFFQVVVHFATEAACLRAKTKLARLGVDSIRFYQEVPRLARSYGYSGECPATERLCTTNLAVPCYESLSDGDVDRISAALGSLGG